MTSDIAPRGGTLIGAGRENGPPGEKVAPRVFGARGESQLVSELRSRSTADYTIVRHAIWSELCCNV